MIDNRMRSVICTRYYANSEAHSKAWVEPFDHVKYGKDLHKWLEDFFEDREFKEITVEPSIDYSHGIVKFEDGAYITFFLEY